MDEFRNIVEKYQSALNQLGLGIDIQTQENENGLLSTFRFRNKWWNISVSKVVDDFVHVSVESYNLNKIAPPDAKGLFHTKPMAAFYLIESLSDVFSSILAHHLGEYLRKQYNLKVEFRRREPDYALWVDNYLRVVVRLKPHTIHLHLHDSKNGKEYNEAIPLGDNCCIDRVAAAITLLVML